MADLEYRTKKDIVVEMIRESILAGEFESGDHLLQEEIARRLNVSVTPVREALRQLEAEGVVVHAPHRGVRVAHVNYDEVREMYLMRGALETLATVEAVANFKRSNIGQLRALQAEFKSVIGEDNLLAVQKQDYSLHMYIYQAAQIPELFRSIRILWTKFPWVTIYVQPGRAIKAAREHEDIIEAIAAGDTNLAGERVNYHVECGAEALMKFLAERFEAPTLT